MLIMQRHMMSCHPKFSIFMVYINHHYQVAYRNNKKSGSHDDFVNFVGSGGPFIYYYHLWLCQVPHLLNFAVPLLPSYAFHESTETDFRESIDTAPTSASKSSSNFSVRMMGRHAMLTPNRASPVDKIANPLDSFENTC